MPPPPPPPMPPPPPPPGEADEDDFDDDQDHLELDSSRAIDGAAPPPPPPPANNDDDDDDDDESDDQQANDDDQDDQDDDSDGDDHPSNDQDDDDDDEDNHVAEPMLDESTAADHHHHHHGDHHDDTVNRAHHDADAGSIRTRDPREAAIDLAWIRVTPATKGLLEAPFADGYDRGAVTVRPKLTNAYHANAITGETSWLRPRAAREAEQAEQERTAARKGPVSDTQTTHAETNNKKKSDTAWLTFQIVDSQGKNGLFYYVNTDTGVATWTCPPEVEADELAMLERKMAWLQLRERQAQEQAGKVKRRGEDAIDRAAAKIAQRKARIKSTQPVEGTDWIVVHTVKDGVFYFNQATRESERDEPDEVTEALMNMMMAEEARLDEAERQANGQSAIAGVDGEGREKREHEHDDDDDDDDDVDNDHSNNDGASNRSSKRPKLDDGDNTDSPVFDAASMTEEERVRLFQAMLAERKVSIFSTWETESAALAKDPRFALVAAKDQRNVFEAWLASRVDEQKQQRSLEKTQLRTKFVDLLLAAKLTHRSRWTDFALKFARDPRFKAIDKHKDREDIFVDFLRKGKAGPNGVIVDNPFATASAASSASSAASTSSSSRKAPSSAASSTSSAGSSKGSASVLDAAGIKQQFMALLREGLPDVDSRTRWWDVKHRVSRDPRYDQVGSATKREDYFEEYVQLRKKETISPEEERRQREERAIREREAKLRTERLQTQRRNDRNQSARIDAVVEQYDALLAETVRRPDITWEHFQSLLEQDSRADLFRNLSSIDLRERFEARVDALVLQSSQAFHAMVRETLQGAIKSAVAEQRDPEMTLSTSLADAMPLLEQHTDFKRLVKLPLVVDEPSDEELAAMQSGLARLEAQYAEAIRFVSNECREEFQQLLTETKSISYKTQESCEARPYEFERLLATLSNDLRFHMLASMEDRRTQWVRDYIRRLHEIGPPAAPTAPKAMDTGR
ncbi:hypothetical protein CAOG_01983 [Capsaspora owczarzaki ATCC 30864]|uniref:FF domain-containing protein n=1 Tax=Capsaspora owczarzaki (strain ATCC 30864) TaxID=595528 RepID=A0A0D2X1F5_CAPO3|nr:hypothetical protein CAOG_01983 [Capsaspora owczarzaki ATCC 30864]KJE90719.1 hypothetical protein CAOG_001983 [Capsaspora owczarzaki ATCC 30864]|eukprot:XP_004364851.1 hypothetical protein CAOG_01983 [Capsaspora owczarzaki ATCC 30864]